MTDFKRASKFIALLLRHKPEVGPVVLDSEGWTSIESLLGVLNRKGHTLTKDDLLSLVARDDKQRYQVSIDQEAIRANQGHSVKSVDLKFEPVEPPEFLFHGTSASLVDEILRTGLKKMNRQHVHLSYDRDTALKVARRRPGTSAIFSVAALGMHRKDHKFFRSANNVWLTDAVPIEFVVGFIEYDR